MNKTVKKVGFMPLVYFVLISGFMVSCSKDNPDKSVGKILIPVNLSTTVSKIQTRVNGSAFENNDEIGLFVLKQPNKITEERHADNVRFVFNSDKWMPDKDVFYPDGENKSTFVAYYPYQQGGVSAGNSSIVCGVKPDQSAGNNYSLSDFLVASVIDVEPKEDPVSLNFKHKLNAVEFIIDPGSAYSSAQDLLAAHPVLIVKGVCITSEYDFQTGLFTNQAGNSDIIPAGEFAVKDNKLVGKRCVIVPQVISSGHILVELSVGGKDYSFTLGEEYRYTSGIREVYTLTLVEAVPENIPGNISASVSDWDNDMNQAGILQENKNSGGVSSSGLYSIAIPDFSKSSVYKAMGGSVQVAEICREYLVSSKNVDNQVVVAYPFKDGKADHSKGIVLQVLNSNGGTPVSASVHGGAVSWNTATGSLTYTKGTSLPLIAIYVDTQGNITSTSEGKVSTAATMYPDVLKDSRDNTEYPVVKIGTRYWMGKNLKATTLTDGSSIPLKEGNTEWKSASKAYCNYNQTDEVLYKYAVVLDKIAPDGWKIPSKSDWDWLVAYVAMNSLLIKDGSWGLTDNKLNLTGFSAFKMGLRTKEGAFYDQSLGFWHSDGGYAYFMSDAVNVYADETTCGCSIRCIRK